MTSNHRSLPALILVCCTACSTGGDKIALPTGADTAGVVKAPFAGTVVDSPVEVGEMATGSDRTLVHLSSHSRQVTGQVARVGYEIDEATRTGEVVVRIPNEDRDAIDPQLESAE